MLSRLKEELRQSLSTSLQKHFASSGRVFPSVEIEIPNDKSHGEFSCNIALKSAKVLRKSPLDLAAEFADVIQKDLAAGALKNKIEKVEVKKPGFINLYVSVKVVHDLLAEVLAAGDDYGRCDLGRNRKMQIEFVSANPTGPLSVAHARQAAVGDALANILQFVGFDVQREFYVNDEGNQIQLLGRSIQCRALEAFGESVPLPEEGYQGDYIRDMAREFVAGHKLHGAEDVKKRPLSEFSLFGVNYLLAVIKQELTDFGVHFDLWAHQSKIAPLCQMEKVLDFLKERGFIYEKDGALWFQSTKLGDDKDRVVKKSDGAYTYLTPDIVYHKDKFDRGFEKVINIWGPDHHGYIPRLKAAVGALGCSPDALEVLIVQLATIYRQGQPVSMSTRRGQYISLREVMEEVGVDASRFFFLLRHISAHLDFDLDLAKKQTPENPVYYIQYAHARIHSILAKAGETGLSARRSDFHLLKQPEEQDLIKKIGLFPEILRICSQQLDPYALVSYLPELATLFHKFYDCHRVIEAEQKELSAERLALIDATRLTLANGLRLLGVSTPKKM